MNQHTLNQLLQEKQRLEATITANCRSAATAEALLRTIVPSASPTSTDTSSSELIRQYIYDQNRAGHAFIAEYNQVLGKLRRV
ncbi:hypothetical protein [Spirosoma agri]|uniref:Uncharacterized protein n=1 Tax=Spirosoma agri TaxID=1987381 RepID=A0A6M0IHM9_9BACT|nr:hypothetical protein [Spirosoma agri]NEU67684.1 hypothetical protein [Spirosoma agri]